MKCYVSLGMEADPYNKIRGIHPYLMYIINMYDRMTIFDDKISGELNLRWPYGECSESHTSIYLEVNGLSV